MLTPLVLMGIDYQKTRFPVIYWYDVGLYPNPLSSAQAIKRVSAVALVILATIGLFISISGTFSGSYFVLFPTIALFIPSMVLFNEGTVASDHLKPEINIVRKTVDFDDGISLHEYKIQITHVNPEDYKRWLLERDPSQQKQKLLEETLLKDRSWPRELTYFQVEQPQSAFLKLLDTRHENNYHSTDNKWYEYLDKGHTYIDFVGSVQEETMFAEFPQLSMLSYATEKCGIHIHPSQKNNPTPFVFPNQKKVCNLEESKNVTITGIAARDWSLSRGSKYSRKDLLYHLHAAYLAFETERIFHDCVASAHTGLWGCGAFCNSEKTMITLQLLAARMAKVRLHLHGVENISECVTMLRGLDGEILKTFKTPNEVLDAILKKQEEDFSWRPKG